MKTKHKGLLLSLGAVLLVSATAIGTMAYLKATDEVTNTFTVGKVALKLDEADVNTDGTYVTNHDDRVKENEYHLMPGHEYYKDPTVTVLEGSEESYVRILVTVNGMTDELRTTLEGVERDDIFGGFSEDWNLVKEYDIDNGMGRTYEFHYKTTVAAPGEDVVLDDLFETITVPDNIEADGLMALGHVNIVVEAQAIQADGFSDKEKAWEAFDGQTK